MATWKRDFASGLIVLVPIMVTLWVILWLYNFVANAPFIQQIELGLVDEIPFLPPEFVRVLLTLVIFTTLVFAVGYLMRTAIGSIVESTVDDLINRLPGLRVVYNASKMAAETALTGTDSLQTPVKVEPWDDDIRMTAFKTGKQADDGREMLFMPTAPNITSGFVIEVKDEDIIEVDERVEEALTRLLSAGFGESDNGPKRDIATITTEQLGDDADEDGDGGRGGDDPTGHDGPRADD